MNLARILYPVRVLGPGERVGLWLCGCTRGCPGCSNPELWSRRPEYEVLPKDVCRLICELAASHPVAGFTISGGEPMDQAEDLAELLNLLAPISSDVLIYTGYRLDALRSRHDPATDRVLQQAAVLIDGPYVEELNNDSVLRGSSNQQIHLLNPKFRVQYKKYFAETHNQIQNFTTADGIVSVGIHHRGFT